MGKLRQIQAAKLLYRFLLICKALFKYRLHTDDELFEKAFSYIRLYY